MELENISSLLFSFDWIFSRWYCLTQFELREIPINIIRIFFTYVWKITLCSNRNLLQTLSSFALKKYFDIFISVFSEKFIDLLCHKQSQKRKIFGFDSKVSNYVYICPQNLFLFPEFPVLFKCLQSEAQTINRLIKLSNCIMTTKLTFWESTI